MLRSLLLISVIIVNARFCLVESFRSGVVRIQELNPLLLENTELPRFPLLRVGQKVFFLVLRLTPVYWQEIHHCLQFRFPPSFNGFFPTLFS